MVRIGPTGPFDEEEVKSPFQVVFLSILMTIIFSGSMAILTLIHRSITWAVWGCIFIILLLFVKELRLGHLLLPFMPFFVWLCFYLSWGLIVSPATDIGFAAKAAVTSLTLATCIAILTSRPHYLQSLANCLQFSVMANLLLWVLAPRSSFISSLLKNRTTETDFSRFGGMFGNANELGYICLIAIIVSALAIPWIAWLGRLSSLPLLYLSASRKSSILFLAILILYVIIVQRRNAKFWVTALVLVIPSVMLLFLNDDLREKSQSAAENPAITRMLDWQEKDSSQKGAETRVDLLHTWLSILHDEPWYGYGLQTMSGTSYVPDHPEIVLIKGPYPLGTHNTYLGVWVDIGPVGFIAFILVLLHYARRSLFAKVDPLTKWVLVAFMVVNLAFLFVSHSHLFSFEGEISFALFFLLPSCLGLRELGRSLA